MLNWIRSWFASAERSPVTLQMLQGTWRMVSVGKNGNFAPPQVVFAAKVTMTIEADQYTIVTNGKTGDRGRIVLDASQSAAHFDQHVTAGDSAGDVMLGIVQFREGLLENCQAKAGGPRPQDFSKQRKDGASLATFKRQSS